MKKDIKTDQIKLIKTLRLTEDYLSGVSLTLGEMLSKLWLPMIVEEVSLLIKRKKVKDISTSWIQSKYKIGYLRSSRVIDELKWRKLVKREVL